MTQKSKVILASIVSIALLAVTASLVYVFLIKPDRHTVAVEESPLEEQTPGEPELQMSADMEAVCRLIEDFYLGGALPPMAERLKERCVGSEVSLLTNSQDFSSVDSRTVEPVPDDMFGSPAFHATWTGKGMTGEVYLIMAREDGTWKIDNLSYSPGGELLMDYSKPFEVKLEYALDSGAYGQNIAQILTAFVWKSELGEFHFSKPVEGASTIHGWISHEEDRAPVNVVAVSHESEMPEAGGNLELEMILSSNGGELGCMEGRIDSEGIKCTYTLLGGEVMPVTLKPLRFSSENKINE